MEHESVEAQVGRHEGAFNSATMETVIDDYTDDAVLESHLAGEVVEFTGKHEILAALTLATAAGVQTRVKRVVATANSVAMQIDDEDGRPFMVSFWELRDHKIARDVSIVLSR